MKSINLVKKKWEQMPVMARASICFSLAMFLQKGLLSLSTPIFTRIMTSVQYEQYTIYYAWSSILTIVATLNLSSGVLNNQLVKGEHPREVIVSSFQGLALVWALGCMLVMALAYALGVRLANLPAYLWFLMFFSFMFTSAYEIWMVDRRFSYDYKAPCIFMVFIAVLNFAVSLLAVLASEAKGEAKILSTILINLTVGVGFWIYNQKKGKCFCNPSIWKAALMFNLPLLPHFLSLTVLNQSDKIIIERMCQPGQAAIYSVAHTVAAIIQLMMTAVNYSLIPWTYQRLKERNCELISRRSNSVLLGVAMALNLMMLFAPEIMWIMAPTAYQEAIYIIPPMAAGIYFNYLYQFYGRIELYHEKTQYMMMGSVACALLNIVLNWIFIGKYGYMAAAYTTLACQMGLCIMHALLAGNIVRREGYSRKPYHNVSIIWISSSVILGILVMPVLYSHMRLRWGLIALVLAGVMVFRRKMISLLKTMLHK